MRPDRPNSTNGPRCGYDIGFADDVEVVAMLDRLLADLIFDEFIADRIRQLFCAAFAYLHYPGLEIQVRSKGDRRPS